ncbi:MAG: FHA domain-containing protein [Gemmataceae bacterium]|nr:FHA domain-containing protein [Gemmataceae bacterium]
MREPTTVRPWPTSAISLVGADGRTIAVCQAQFLIGRSPQCHLALQGDGVDDLHCAVVARDGRHFVRNFSRPHGTCTTGRQLLGEMELRDRDWIQIGGLRLVVRIAQDLPEATMDTVFDQATVFDLVRPAAPAPVPRNARPTVLAPRTDGVQEVPVPIASPARCAPPMAASAAVASLPAPRRAAPTLIRKKPELDEHPSTPEAAPPSAPAASHYSRQGANPSTTAPPRRTRATMVDLSPSAPEAPAAGSTPLVSAPLPRKARVTQMISKSELAESVEATAPPAAASAAPEPPLARGMLPGYAMAWKQDDADGEARPVMRLVVGRKDQAQPMLRKWEMEAARGAAQHPARRRSSGTGGRRLMFVGVFALMIVSVVGGFYLGRPRAARAKAPNPFVITIEQWERLSEGDRNDPLYLERLEKPMAPDGPAVEPGVPQRPNLPPAVDPNL